jgi:hypothetical protein
LSGNSFEEECVKQMANFCPTELYVPMYSNYYYEYNGEKNYARMGK